MIATPTQTEERAATQGAAIEQLESLVPAAVRLAQLHDQGEVSEEEFERGLSNLFRSARARSGLVRDRVHQGPRRLVGRPGEDRTRRLIDSARRFVCSHTPVAATVLWVRVGIRRRKSSTSGAIRRAASSEP